jgi:PAS domain S-box-containing protein
MALLALAISRLKANDGMLVALLAALPVVCTFMVCVWNQLKPKAGAVAPKLSASEGAGYAPSSAIGGPGYRSVSALPAQAPTESMTWSGLFDSPTPPDMSHPDMALSGDFSIIDMVSRLEPRGFHWIESSLAEQEFLGWTLTELQRKSFLDIVHLGDRQRAEEALRQALIKGNFLGLIIRIRTAQGKTKAIEVNAGARYTANHQVSYLRRHVADVTVKVRAERELRLRTRELTQVNEQLRQINRVLEELKDRYTDLYENAPAMYFSLDSQGRLIECNQTFLTSLKRRREELIGHGFERFLEGPHLEHCLALFAQLLETGSIETESRWVRSGGEEIDVWINGRAIRGPRGNMEQTRCVAQDVTAKHRLEAELYGMNQSLAHANADLSRKNRELDEFVYVVSHDLQEPLRTLTAFSDFLIQDHAEQLDSEGHQYVRRLVDASRRMRSMINGLLNLSRAGKVTDEFGPVPLAELVADIRADLGELIRNRQAELRLVGPDVVLSGDRRRLLQLLANLASNGIKYNASAIPCVEIGTIAPADECQTDPGSPGAWLTVFIRDNGIGIDPRHHQRIFQLFRRLHSQEEYEGTGVGLAICCKIAQAHGGRIWVESTPAAGATFFVTLPRGTPAPANSESPGGFGDSLQLRDGLNPGGGSIA